jgi:hypothetical protein
MSDQDEEQTSEKVKIGRKSVFEADVLHFGLDIDYIPAWGPNPQDNNIIATFRASMLDSEGRKIAETMVLLEDLIATVGKSVYVVTSAFQIVDRMKGFKLQMVAESKESLVERIDNMIENLNTAKNILINNDVITLFELGEDSPSRD